MAWQPTRDPVSQLHDDGSGWDDCWEAALAYYLYCAGKLPASLDPLAAINEISLVARGAPDSPYNGPTTLGGAETSLDHWGIPADYTASYIAALNAPWAILLVDGTVLRPAQYPASWFGSVAGQANHFIIWLPQWKGAANWFMDPLNPARAYVQYDLASVAQAFSGAYLLPSTGQGETPQQRFVALRRFGLLPQPRHGATSLCVVPQAGSGLVEQGTAEVAGETWRRLQFRSYHGWAPAEYLRVA